MGIKVHVVFAPPRGAPRDAELMGRVYAPPGPLYIAAAVREYVPGVEVSFTDGIPLGFRKTLEAVTRAGPDILLVSTVTSCASGAYALVDALKKANPALVAVVGGPHASGMPVEPLQSSSADFSVFGEGERTVVELVREIASGGRDFGRIDGLCWRDRDRVVRNRPRELIPDLDEVPLPARDLADPGLYRGWFVQRRSPDVVVMSSRGCQFRCSFCANPVFGRTLRLRSPARYVDELESLRRDQGFNEFFDGTDEFNNNSAHAIAVCEEMRRRRLGLTWKANVRATNLSEDLVRAMAEAGCWYVQVGVESGNQRTLDGVGKGVTLEDVERSCRLLKRYGIKVLGLFMFMHAWEEDGRLAFETLRDNRRTLAYAWRLHDRGLIDYMSWSIPMPWPGSKLLDVAVRHGLLREGILGDWDRWVSQADFVMDLPGISARDAGRLYMYGAAMRAWFYLVGGDWKLRHLPSLALKSVATMNPLTRLRLSPAP